MIILKALQKLSALAEALCILCACSSCQKTPPAADDAERIPVTMLYTIDLSHFEALVESTYPDIDLQIERNTEATIDGETERRLRNGHGTDIITSKMANISMLDKLLDLSAESYVTNYQSGLIHDIMSKDGRTVFIPVPGQYYGYIYNVTLAEEAGIPRPETPGDIMEMMKTAKEKGIGVGADGSVFGIPSTMMSVSTYLLGTQIPDFLGQAEGVLWSSEMAKRGSTFAGHLESCVDMPLEMVENGYLNVDFFSGVGNSVRIYEHMRDKEMMICFGDANMLKMLEEAGGSEYTMLPFLSSEGNHAWTLAEPDAYLALNAELGKPENAVTLDAADRVLELLSSQEGQRAFIQDVGAGESYLTDTTVDMEEFPAGLEDCIRDGYVYNIRIPSEIMRYLGSRMAAVLTGKTDVETALQEVDAYYQEGGTASEASGELVGICGKDMIFENYNVRQQETEIGDLIADAAAEITGADIAFVNGGSIRGSLYEGSIYSYDLDAVCPYPNQYVLLETDAGTIRAMLENGLSKLVQENGIPGGRFLNVSGLRYTFHAPGEDGAGTLADVTLSDGSPLEDGKTYTIAVTDYMAGSTGYMDGNGDGYTMLNVYSAADALGEHVTLKEETGLTLTDILLQYLEKHNTETVSGKLDGRIKVVD